MLVSHKKTKGHTQIMAGSAIWDTPKTTHTVGLHRARGRGKHKTWAEGFVQKAGLFKLEGSQPPLYSDSFSILFNHRSCQ